MSEFAQGKERRREHRARIARPVYVQGADADGVQFEELRTTRDLGHWGFYFVTEREFVPRWEWRCRPFPRSGA